MISPHHDPGASIAAPAHHLTATLTAGGKVTVTEPPPEIDYARRAAFARGALLFRTCGRLLRSARPLFIPHGIASHGSLEQSCVDFAVCLQSCEQVAARYAGPVLRESAEYSRADAAGHLLEIFVLLLQAERGELEQLTTDSRCLFRAQAAALLQIRDAILPPPAPKGDA